MLDVKKIFEFQRFLSRNDFGRYFDPSGLANFDFVSRKIVDGLNAHGMIKINDFDNEKKLTA